MGRCQHLGGQAIPPPIHEVEGAREVEAFPSDLRDHLGHCARAEGVHVLRAALEAEGVRRAHHDTHRR